MAHLPGLIPKPGWPYDSQNAGLPIPLLRAYAFTEWSWATLQRPNGTDFWAPNGAYITVHYSFIKKLRPAAPDADALPAKMALHGEGAVDGH